MAATRKSGKKSGGRSGAKSGSSAGRGSSGGRKYGPAASKRVESAMKRRKRGTLRSGKGGRGGAVKSREQAIAIGLSEAREKGAKVPAKPRRSAAKKGTARKRTSTKRASTKRSTTKRSTTKRSASKKSAAKSRRR
jgi:hypothetical protein